MPAMPAALPALALLELPYPHLDPVAIDFPGPIDVRWYGLGYLVAFTVGYLVLRHLSRTGFLRLSEEAIGDLIFGLIVGTILGGRLGYILFYDFGEFAAHPARILRIWEGGLSFHGGLIGVLLAAWWFTRKHQVTFLHLGDSLALAVPFGIFAVRVANFINGELFGRVASASVPWAMRFPTDPVALAALGAEGAPMRERELIIDQAYRTGTWDAIRAMVPLRHPSQLYEALGEGLLLGLVLWAAYRWTRRRGNRPPDGTFGGIFLLGYGLVRATLEQFRQPDAQFRGPGDPLGTVLGPFTMGQVLSAFMILAGVGLLVRSWVVARRRVKGEG
jgi:phosphatidylglycerol:prolipoprotein diacylglycerol transferase